MLDTRNFVEMMELNKIEFGHVSALTEIRVGFHLYHKRLHVESYANNDNWSQIGIERDSFWRLLNEKNDKLLLEWFLETPQGRPYKRESTFHFELTNIQWGTSWTSTFETT
jgi:hypothetical protein